MLPNKIETQLLQRSINMENLLLSKETLENLFPYRHKCCIHQCGSAEHSAFCYTSQGKNDALLILWMATLHLCLVIFLCLDIAICEEPFPKLCLLVLDHETTWSSMKHVARIN